MHLDALLADLAHAATQLHLGLRQGAASHRARFTQLEAGVVAHRASQFQLHLHIGDAVAQGLEGCDRHAELLAGVEVLGGEGDQLVHEPHALGTQGSDAHIGGRLHELEGVCGDPCGRRVSQRQFGRPRAVLGGVGAHRHAGCVPLYQVKTDAGLVVGIAARPCSDPERIGFIPGRHDALGALESGGAFRRGGAGADMVQSVPRSRLLVGPHHQGLAARHLGGPSRLEIARCRAQHHGSHQSPCGIGRVHQRAPQFFHDHHGFHRAHAQAVVVGGQGQTCQAQFSELLVHRTGAATALGQGVTTLERERPFGPTCHRVAQGELVIGEVKIHVQSPRHPSTVCATMLRCTSLEPP